MPPGFFLLLHSKTCYDHVWKTVHRFRLRLDENLSSLCLVPEHIFDFCPERPKCGTVSVPHSLRSQCFPLLRDPPPSLLLSKVLGSVASWIPDRHGHLERRMIWRLPLATSLTKSLKSIGTARARMALTSSLSPRAKSSLITDRHQSAHV